MERFLCLNCSVVDEITRRGECGTCGSSAVVSEHSHKPLEPFPGYAEWLMDARETLRGLRAS